MRLCETLGISAQTKMSFLTIRFYTRKLGTHCDGAMQIAAERLGRQNEKINLIPISQFWYFNITTCYIQ
jgi:hypothetical protein